jgi:hypothetical protein
VHVYRDGQFVVKWDVDNWKPMRGKAPARVLRLLEALVKEKRL